MRRVLLAFLLPAVLALPQALAAAPPAAVPLDAIPGPGVTARTDLAAFHPPLRGTAMDSPIFVLEGSRPGATLFVLGGSHAGETSGILAALLLAERAEIEQGRLVVVPWGNRLALEPEKAVRIETPTGPRRIALGGRRSLESHYGESDPETYTSPRGGEFPGNERRNLNRVWPGVADGTPTEQVAHAIVEAIRHHGCDLAFDLHETSGLGSTLPWTIAGRPDEVPLMRAAVAAVNRELGLDLVRWREVDSPPGMSRVEWGPATGARTFLTETVIGHVTPLSMRVAVQLALIRGVIDAHNEAERSRVAAAGDPADAPPPKLLLMSGLPDLRSIADGDLGLLLQEAAARGADDADDRTVPAGPSPEPRPSADVVAPPAAAASPG
jgi:predicted deacylase